MQNKEIKNSLGNTAFLNPMRVEVPDIDLDFQDDQRERIVNYLRDRYGVDHVATITTFGMMKAKAALQDTARAIGTPYDLVRRLSQTVRDPIDPTEGWEAVISEPQVQLMLKQDDELATLAQKAAPMYQRRRHHSTHAAGVVISAQPLMDVAPLMRSPFEGLAQVQVEMNDLAKVGLIKMDILGIDYLTVLDRAIKLIKERRGVIIDPWQLPTDDQATFAMLSAGHTHGVFQLSSEGMRRQCIDLKPNSIGDLMALVALFRPGPLHYIPQYIAVKQGTIAFQSPHPLIDNIVRETHGVIVYQEQVLQIARQVAGFTFGEADILRKAIGKKKADLLKAQRESFLAKAQSHSNITLNEAKGIWDFFEPFAQYGFNMSHACCYGYLAYQTAYLKANYTVEYMAALLDVVSDSQEKVAAAVAETQMMGLNILPPTNNVGVRIENDALRLGLRFVKGVGPVPASTVANHWPFTQPHDVTRLKVNKGVLEALIKAGVFAPLKRSVLLEALAIVQKGKKQPEGQSALWDPGVTLQQPNHDQPEVPLGQILEWEREYLGVYLTDNPVRRAMQATDSTPIVNLVTGEKGVTIVGELCSTRLLFTRAKKELMIIATVRDLTGPASIVVFPTAYTNTKDLWVDGKIVVVTGETSMRDGALQLVVAAASGFQEEEEVVDTRLPSYLLSIEMKDPLVWLNAWKLALARPGPVQIDMRLVRGTQPLAVLRAKVGVAATEELRRYGTLQEVA